jgi:hypothetical protein
MSGGTSPSTTRSHSSAAVMRFSGYWRMLAILVFLVAGITAATAQESGDTPHVTIQVTAEGIAAPEEIPEGVVRITFENGRDVPVAPFITRLNQGVTYDEMREVYGQEDPTAAMALSSDLGGMLVMPGTTLDVTFDFVPGSYFVSNLFGGEDFTPFSIIDREGEGAAPPEADISVALIDFAFNLPISIPAGSHNIHLENTGEQFHMLSIYRLSDAFTVREMNERLVEDSEELPEGVEEVMTWFPMSEGEQAWITLDLEPGTYLIMCPLPDLEGSGHAHHELGMRQTLIVSEAE